ncbi:hypothetical protein OXIME_001092 [Oxyplasma meridianum]|uniref:Uncharacterized protein n=1 Tax=Oxyplasma meridianum TaxID=3073602 RepID=A0AAX4NH91_9ARCH
MENHWIFLIILFKKNIIQVQNWIKHGFITIVKLDDIDNEKLKQSYAEIDKIDNIIQQGDKIVLAAFCLDKYSNLFHSFDTNILESGKLKDYVKKFEKSIREL